MTPTSREGVWSLATEESMGTSRRLIGFLVESYWIRCPRGDDGCGFSSTRSRALSEGGR